MDLDKQVLSDIVVYSKYAKFIPEINRRETWNEIVSRYLDMMCKKYPQLSNEIERNGEFIRNKKVLPSMRALQFAGLPISKNEARIYNCCYLPVDHYLAFSESMFLLLGGSGVGYSVQTHHVSKLPPITIPTKKRKFLIGDSIEGWADAVKALMKAYLFGKTAPVFDFSDIRQKGATLVTAGGKAPGPEPLKECLFQIQKVLDRKSTGQYLTSLECHDILCHIANAVLAGGIRRAAMIALFSHDDEDMLTCKFGDWWQLNEQRGRSNNSVVLKRDEISKEVFESIWKKVKASNSGEPGVYWTNDKELGTNPCCEISLEPFQFCNLTEINVSDIESEKDLHQRAEVAAFFGTLQAGFTDFHYLRDIWQKTTEEQALIGVGMTGIGSGEVLKYDLEQVALIVKACNLKISSIINTQPAARCTTVKPSGTSSLVLGTSSGIHAWHNDFYIRRMRIGKNEALYSYLLKTNPDLVEDDVLKPTIQGIISIPQKAPKGSIIRTESATECLSRVKLFNEKWVHKGHRYGKNTNNVSATVSLQDNEWELVGEWMWSNRYSFNGLSVLPYFGGSYTQAPFEDITEQKYNEMIVKLHSIDLTQVRELDDHTDLSGEAACAGGQCEI